MLKVVLLSIFMCSCASLDAYKPWPGTEDRIMFKLFAPKMLFKLKNPLLEIRRYHIDISGGFIVFYNSYMLTDFSIYPLVKENSRVEWRLINKSRYLLDDYTLVLYTTLSF